MNSSRRHHGERSVLRRVSLVGLSLLALAYAACTLNPQPIPPGGTESDSGANDNGKSDGEGGGSNPAFGADGGDAEPPIGPDAGDGGMDGGDAGDAGPDASDASTD